jgi:hypothetical protein
MFPITQVRIAVTGGRDFSNHQLVQEVFDGIARIRWRVTLSHGDAKGLDTIADELAQNLNWAIKPYPVTSEDWKFYGKKAGHLRNHKMLSESNPHILLSFPGGRGTADCIQAALKMGIPVESFYDAPKLTLCAKIDHATDIIAARLEKEKALEKT